MSTQRIAILGAGPIGLEAALYGARLGHDIHVYERGELAQHVRDWGFVRLFSPFRMNRSELGRQRLLETNRTLPSDSAYLTGQRYFTEYLLPLSDLPELKGRIHEHCRVVGVGRSRFGKGLPLGVERTKARFRILLEDRDGEREESADIVLDCTGTYGQPRLLGDGNVAALGERSVNGRIQRRLEDFAGAQRTRYRGKRILLVGSGQSAATALDALLLLDGVTIDWAVRKSSEMPYRRVPDDPLHERDRLAALGNQLARGVDPRVRYRAGTRIDAIAVDGDHIQVSLHAADGTRDRIEVDIILSLVGYRPDRSIYRELQVHECYASEGPMKLAATLINDPGEDCLTQSGKGPESLVSPEPGFFILGSKSYGTNASFLLRIGIEQVRDAYQVIDTNPDLDLYSTLLVKENSDV